MRLVYILMMLLCLGIVAAEEPFNIEIDLPDNYKNIESGEDIWFTTKIINLGNEKRIDITLKYDILNINQYSVYSKSETVAIETQASFVGNLEIPKILSEGNYVLRVRVQPIGSDIPPSESEVSFRVKSADGEMVKEIYYMIGLLFIIAAIILGLKKSDSLIQKIKLRYKVWKIVKGRKL